MRIAPPVRPVCAGRSPCCPVGRLVRFGNREGVVGARRAQVVEAAIANFHIWHVAEITAVGSEANCAVLDANGRELLQVKHVAGGSVPSRGRLDVGDRGPASVNLDCLGPLLW